MGAKSKEERMNKTRLYPTLKELRQQGEFLSSLSEKEYEKFERQGIPSEVTIYVKRRKVSF